MLMDVQFATVKPTAGFSPETDAKALHEAMKGRQHAAKVDQAVVDILCRRTNAERQEIIHSFLVLYAKNLKEELKSELSGDLARLVQALLEKPATYDAEQLHKAIQGLGTDEMSLIEILTTRSNADIRLIKEEYLRMYGVELEKDLGDDTSGFFRQLLKIHCQAERDETHRVDAAQAKRDAETLVKAGEQRWGTDAAVFFEVMAKQNEMQLRAVFSEYEKIAGHGIDKDIETDFSSSFPLSYTHSFTSRDIEVKLIEGMPPMHVSQQQETKKVWVSTPSDVRDGLLGIWKCAVNRPLFFAERLHASMKGLGTRDNTLIRLVVSRCETDLLSIKQEFEKVYKKPLEYFIQHDCSGVYADGLVALAKGNTK